MKVQRCECLVEDAVEKQVDIWSFTVLSTTTIKFLPQWLSKQISKYPQFVQLVSDFVDHLLLQVYFLLLPHWLFAL